MANDDRNPGYRNQEGGAGTTGTGTAQATETPTVKVATNRDGVVEIGTWNPLPPGYELIHGRAGIVEALMNFNATELREKIADLCVKF
jgi:hypothetical protein